MQVAKQTMTFMTDTKTKDRLDKVANAMDRDRSYVLNLAIEA